MNSRKMPCQCEEIYKKCREKKQMLISHLLTSKSKATSITEGENVTNTSIREGGKWKQLWENLTNFPLMPLIVILHSFY